MLKLYADARGGHVNYCMPHALRAKTEDNLQSTAVHYNYLDTRISKIEEHDR